MIYRRTLTPMLPIILLACAGAAAQSRPASRPHEAQEPRRPKDDADLRYWLEIMEAHGFSAEEMASATGLTGREIGEASARLKASPATRPAPAPAGALRVLPYPGGRHPRLGFFDGAVNPQRETKASVFTPWDPASYVVVDVPEAIWWEYDLLYLAHAHVETIWTKRNIELEKLEWTRREDSALICEWRLPNGVSFTSLVRPARDGVRMELRLKNGMDRPLTYVRMQMCVMTGFARGFEQQTDEHKVNFKPYIAGRSADGRRWIITAWEGCERTWGNPAVPCLHSDPLFPDLAPGQEHTRRGWLSFYEGSEIAGEIERIKSLGWIRPER